MDESLAAAQGHVSALSCFPPSVGRDVAVAVVKPLAAGLGNPNTHSLLRTDRQVKWTMEVLCYGLTLPLDRDTVKLCVDVYTDWLMALVFHRSSTPPPINRDPNLYVQKILRHLYFLFLPRSDQESPVYLTLCQQVLSAVRSLVRKSSMMSRETWETLLHFLLRINHAMLAPPTAAGVLSDLSMAVFLEVWLQSCSQCFPSRLLWQTCRQMLHSWKHQPAVVEQWSRGTAALTSRLLPLVFGSSFPPFKVSDEDAALVPAAMGDRHVSHTWFRFLHMFSNPVDLVRSASGASQDEVLKTGDDQLPGIFFRAMRGVNELVNAFLGVAVVNREQPEQLQLNTGITTRIHFRDRLPSLGVSVSQSPFRDHLPAHGLLRPRSGSAPPTPVNIHVTDPPPPRTSPPSQKREPKAPYKFSLTSSSRHYSSLLPPFPLSLCSSLQHLPHPLRCNLDSLLHLFGSWLFDAALITTDSNLSGRHSDVTLLSERWAAGRAEACGTLCRIFTCKKTAENILSVYLSRFYLVLLQSLQEACPLVVASILLNSTGLFCCDLKGINLLLPTFISVLESVLLDRDLIKFKGLVSLVDLRQASIFILLSLLPLPLQLRSVQSQVSLAGKLPASDVTGGNFLCLKHRLFSLLIGALQTETDTCNIQLLLSAMLNVVHDSAAVAAAGSLQQEMESQSKRTGRTRRNSGTTSFSGQSDAAAVLWVHMVHFLTRRLTSQWRNDSAVCLLALEVLGGLAKVEVQVEDMERRRVVSSVCTYIVFQCSRPPPLHSKDLHSIIVAAFFCLNIWLTRHPALLNQQECLSEVLEIVELGISGSKSRQKQEVKWKEEKELNPASLRVKEAAEATLNCVMQVSGACTNVDRSLNEDAVIGSYCLTDSNLKKFRYFVLESSVILGLLEPEPEQAQSPSLMVVIRGPSGCNSWSLQLHLLPRSGQALTQNILIPEKRSVTPEVSGTQCGVKHHLIPENIKRFPSVKADQSIPALHNTVTHEQQLDYLQAALKTQNQIETQPRGCGHSGIMTTCRPPLPVSNFQVTRLFLSHLGLLTPESVKDPGINGILAPLASLDSSLPGFSEKLRCLDQLPSRTCESAFVLYMRAGQRTATEILRNVENYRNVQINFLDFLSSLGQPEEVGRQQQVGGANPSSSDFAAVLSDSGGAVFDGRRFVLKSTDALMDITFIVPSTQTCTGDWLKSSEEASSSNQNHPDVRSDSTPKSTSCPAEGMKSCCCFSEVFDSKSKILIVWAECFEDIERFPLSDLLSETRTQTENSASNVHLLFIHPLKTGLYRICFHGNVSSKLGLVAPLVSGSVVSRRSLGFLVTEMVINCCHRRRLERDSAPPPHVRRKHMINDIILHYSSRRSEPAFYSGLFHR
ncbi:ral GTPase-activating protein subunit beta isoform X3 [Kryptolebias marmoratus]|uniref:ral GTPase-activating protein subunit beta isoform X3 n=1 Tax=Kryptolebias marmoratus TaxID=37003 RepID=UPI0018AD002B|nr:ral GTPase-activating protein subunit beta isoform X3 [Kryptolebias marmoratus]